jgi:hypothetical protein
VVGVWNDFGVWGLESLCPGEKVECGAYAERDCAGQSDRSWDNGCGRKGRAKPRRLARVDCTKRPFLKSLFGQRGIWRGQRGGRTPRPG